MPDMEGEGQIWDCTIRNRRSGGFDGADEDEGITGDTSRSCCVFRQLRRFMIYDAT